MFHQKSLLVKKVILLMLFSSNVFATKDLSEMSLDELLNMRASVAEVSGEEDISKTPAVVSRYNMEDMEAMGLHRVIDVLNFIPGVEVKLNIFGMYTVAIRGLFDNFNQKVLFLLDGTPYYMYSHSIIPLMGIPTSGISHIEVIRGPGAVIFGTNASAGVINIVTRKSGKSFASLEGGQHSHFNGKGFYTHQFGKNKNVFLSLESKTGGNFKSYHEGTNNNGNVRMGNKVKAIATGLQWEKTNVLFSAFHVENYGVALHVKTNNSSEWDEQSVFFHIDHTFDIFSGDLKTYFDFNDYEMDLFTRDTTTPFIPNGPDGSLSKMDDDRNRRIRGGVTYNKTLFNNYHFLLGFEHENRASGTYSTHDSNGNKTLLLAAKTSVNESAVFHQSELSFGDFRFLAGARFTTHQTSGDAVTPRASIVYSINDHNSLKFLYSKGFNAANALQSQANGTTVIGNPNLEPEKNETFDLAYSLTFDNTLLVANIFKTNLSDGIARVQYGSGTSVQYINQTKFERYGAELDFQKAFKNFKVFTNFTYLHKANEVWEDDAKNAMIPKFQMALGQVYTFLEHHHFGSHLWYKSALNVEGGGKELSSIFEIDLNYEFHFNRYLTYVTVKNLLDKVPRGPSLGSAGIATPTLGTNGGRSIHAGLKVSF